MDSFFLIGSEKDIAFFKFESDSYKLEPFDENKIELDRWIQDVYERFLVDHLKSPLKIIITNSRFTIVPNTLFLPTLTFNIFENSFGKKKIWEHVYFNLINSFQSTIVYGKPIVAEKIKQGLKNKAVITHMASNLCEYLKSQIHIETPLLFLYNNNAFLLQQSNGKLKICTHFEYESNEDVIYFILATLESFDFNHQDNINFINLDNLVNIKDIQDILNKIKSCQNLKLHTLSINQILK